MNDRAIELLRNLVQEGRIYYELNGECVCRYCLAHRFRPDSHSFYPNCLYAEASAILKEIDDLASLDIASTY